MDSTLLDWATKEGKKINYVTALTEVAGNTRDSTENNPEAAENKAFI